MTKFDLFFSNSYIPHLKINIGQELQYSGNGSNNRCPFLVPDLKKCLYLIFSFKYNAVVGF